MDMTKRSSIIIAIEIQQIPAPTFTVTGRVCACCLLRRVERFHDEVGNVYGLLKVESQRSMVKPLIISAHLDTVFPLDMDLEVKREDDKVFGIGIGDNSMGVAALVGLMWVLRERLPSPLAPLPKGEDAILVLANLVRIGRSAG
jgi:acetylornithine deacetylase/succinyl-diaminopimelate desuccinylase-like protein